jgi:hypothetical protein
MAANRKPIGSFWTPPHRLGLSLPGTNALFEGFLEKKLKILKSLAYSRCYTEGINISVEEVSATRI